MCWKFPREMNLRLSFTWRCVKNSGYLFARHFYLGINKVMNWCLNHSFRESLCTPRCQCCWTRNLGDANGRLSTCMSGWLAKWSATACGTVAIKSVWVTTTGSTKWCGVLSEIRRCIPFDFRNLSSKAVLRVGTAVTAWPYCSYARTESLPPIGCPFLAIQAKLWT